MNIIIIIIIIISWYIALAALNSWQFLFLHLPSAGIIMGMYHQEICPFFKGI